MASWKPIPLQQPRRGYRYSVDALLLAAFSLEFQPRYWLDIGTGCGVIAYYLARNLPDARGVAIERQPELAMYARRNCDASRTLVVQGDVRRFPWRPHLFDTVVCNPPYYLPGHGKMKKDPVAAQARHALHGGLDAFLDTAARALKPGGRFCGVLPYAFFQRWEPGWRARGWWPSQLLRVASFCDRPVDLVCFALVREEIETPLLWDLVLYHAHRVYTESASAFFARLTAD